MKYRVLAYRWADHCGWDYQGSLGTEEQIATVELVAGWADALGRQEGERWLIHFSRVGSIFAPELFEPAIR